jgi:hypothetical protein
MAVRRAADAHVRLARESRALAPGKKAMATPLFQTYGVGLPPAARRYCDAMLALPAMRSWLEDARREAETVARFEQ